MKLQTRFNLLAVWIIVLFCFFIDCFQHKTLFKGTEAETRKSLQSFSTSLQNDEDIERNKSNFSPTNLIKIESAEDVRRFLDVAKMFQDNGELQKAEKTLLHALTLDPTNAEIRFKIGWIQYLQRKESESFRRAAHQNFEFSMKLKPQWIAGNCRLILDEGINNIFSNISKTSDNDVKKIAEILLKYKYTPDSIQKKFGFCEGTRTPGPYYATQNLINSGAQPVNTDPLDVLINLFVLGFALNETIIIKELGQENFDCFTKLGMICWHSFDSSMCSSYVQIFPLDYNIFHSDAPSLVLLATDWPPPFSTKLVEDAVMYIGPDSIALVQHAPRTLTPTLLDICCGSGIQGIVAAKEYAQNVVCADINPRAIRFTNFNAALNGVEKTVVAMVSDVYNDLNLPAAQKFSKILANPPFIPVPNTLHYVKNRYGMFSDGGENGENVIRKILKSLHLFLEDGGIMSMVTELANADCYDVKICSWCKQNKIKAVVIHNKKMLSAAEYSWRRSKIPFEEKIWINHLLSKNITSMSTGFIFASCNNLQNHIYPDEKVKNFAVGELWNPINPNVIHEVACILQKNLMRNK